MTPRRIEWKIGSSTLILGERTLIMGVLNVTPDSFSDGGRYMDPDLAYARALEMEDQGADLIDIGAESTRPGSERISEAEELRRLVPVLKRLKGKLSIPICVDTYKQVVAAKALEHGAQIINDPSGLTWEPDLVKVVRESGAGLVINHMRGTPETWATLPPVRDVVGTVAAELEAAVHRARRAGIAGDSIVVDPGFGFGKRKEQNSELLGRLDELRSRVDQPVLVGASRKSFLSQADPRDTEFATAAAVAIAILRGAAIIRVHDVTAMRAAAGVADAVLESLPEPNAPDSRRKPAPTVRKDRPGEEGEPEGSRTLVWRPKPEERETGSDDRSRRDLPIFDPGSRNRAGQGKQRQVPPSENAQRGQPASESAATGPTGKSERREGGQPRSGKRDSETSRRPGRPPAGRPLRRDEVDEKGPQLGRRDKTGGGARPYGQGKSSEGPFGPDTGGDRGPGGFRPPRRGGGEDRPRQGWSTGGRAGRRPEGAPPGSGGRPTRSGGSGRPPAKRPFGTGEGQPFRSDGPARGGGSRPPRRGPGGGPPKGPQGRNQKGDGGGKPPRKNGGAKPRRYGGGPPPRKRT